MLLDKLENQNFIPLPIVNDVISNPTYVPDAAAAICNYITRDRCDPILNLVCQGSCSRFDFEYEVLKKFDERLINLIEPISFKEFREKMGNYEDRALDTTLIATEGLDLPHWQESVNCYSERLKEVLS